VASANFLTCASKSSLLNTVFATTVSRQIMATMCAGFSLKKTWRDAHGNSYADRVSA
jgi:hypothetical protein